MSAVNPAARSWNFDAFLVGAAVSGDGKTFAVALGVFAYHAKRSQQRGSLPPLATDAPPGVSDAVLPAREPGDAQ